MNQKDVLFMIVCLLVIFGVPAIPEIIVWQLFDPVTPYQKLQCLIFCVILYVLSFIVWGMILDRGE